MRARLIRAVLAMYPRAVRERYGAEIADLLHRSPRPVRDLADTARVAFTERTAAVTLPPLLTAARTTMILLAVPVALTAMAFAMVSTLSVVIQSVAPTTGPRTAMTLAALATAPVAVFAVWWGRRMGRSTPAVAPAAAVPTLFAASVVGFGMAPSVVLPGDTVAQALRGVGPASATWCVALTAVVLLVHRVRTLGHPLVATLVSWAGGLVALELCTIVHVVSTMDALTAPRRYAALWYPAAVTGTELGQVADSGGMIMDELGILPIVLTLCTLFTLGMAAAARHHPPTPATAMPVTV